MLLNNVAKHCCLWFYAAQAALLLSPLHVTSFSPWMCCVNRESLAMNFNMVCGTTFPHHSPHWRYGQWAQGVGFLRQAQRSDQRM
jgi:hypothetical protein